MNEQLETARDEIQSITAELTSVNEELRIRNQEVTQVHSDLLNFAVAVDIPMLTLDLARRIRYLTPKAFSVLNVLPTDIGRPIDELALNIAVPDLSAQIEAVCRTRLVCEREVQDKLGHWHRLQIHPHTTTDQDVDGAILSFADIDAWKQLVADAENARAEAERANIAKDDFLSTLSHELRTPLSAMLLNAQRLRSGQRQRQSELERAAQALEHAARAQVKLIDDLLDVSRVVADKLTLECREIDLCGAVQASVDSVSSSIKAKQLALDLSFDPTPSLIWADHVRVQQIVSNLLTNAVKFTPPGGRLSVVVDRVANLARVRVSDTGIGIAADFVPNVFARFSQADTSITRKYGGLGLGLALVRHLVELHGGAVRAESAGLGRGATFVVTFPLLQASPGAEDQPPSQPMHALDRPGKTKRYDALAGLRVLIVDDDQPTREAVFEVLQLAGARVEQAASAAEGMNAIDSFEPQVIVCDIAMPLEDGYTFMRKLRARGAGYGASTPALALTALTAQDDKDRALAAGFQLHLAKPIDIDRLRDAVLALSKLQVPGSTAGQRRPSDGAR
jgi:two-component system CheB/CheR fusion protein